MAALARSPTRRRAGRAEREDELNWLSLRNVPEVHLLAPDQLNTYDVLVSDDVVFTKEALDEFLGVPGESAKAWPLAEVTRTPRPRRRGIEQRSPTRATSSWRRWSRRRATGCSTRTSTRSWSTRTRTRPRSRSRSSRSSTSRCRRQHAQPAGQAQAHPDRFGQAQGHQARDRELADGDRIDIFGGPVA